MADEPENTQTDPTPAAVVAPVAASQALHVSDDTPSPQALPGKPLEKGGQGKAVVRTPYPIDRFEHNVKGVDPITGHGTEVDRSKVKALLEAAEESGLVLEEVDQNA